MTGSVAVCATGRAARAVIRWGAAEARRGGRPLHMLRRRARTHSVQASADAALLVVPAGLPELTAVLAASHCQVAAVPEVVSGTTGSVWCWARRRGPRTRCTSRRSASPSSAARPSLPRGSGISTRWACWVPCGPPGSAPGTTCTSTTRGARRRPLGMAGRLPRRGCSDRPCGRRPCGPCARRPRRAARDRRVGAVRQADAARSLGVVDPRRLGVLPGPGRAARVAAPPGPASSGAADPRRPVLLC